MFEDRVITIAEYFLERYKIRLTHPHLPLVIQKRHGGKGSSYHQIECLDIAEGVRVTNQKMTRQAQECMIATYQPISP